MDINGSKHRIRIITGHYGSGKTEFALNLAVRLRESYDNVAIADLDVINLYFRSREKEEEMNNIGIRVFSSSVRASAVDIPAVSVKIFLLGNKNAIKKQLISLDRKSVV